MPQTAGRQFSDHRMGTAFPHGGKAVPAWRRRSAKSRSLSGRSRIDQARRPNSRQ
jgi:hypothetical protein